MPGDVKRFLARGAMCVLILLGASGCERLKPLDAAPPSADVLFTSEASVDAESAAAEAETTPTLAADTETATATETSTEPAETPSSESTTTATPEVAPLPLQPDENIYLVMEGDTWESIAAAINCDADLIMERNLLSGDIAPLPGQQIIIPADCLPAAVTDETVTAYPTAIPDEAETVYPTALPAETAAATATPATITYTVRQGDTLSSIARRYATTVTAIRALNPSLSDPNYLAPGTVLTIQANTAAAVRVHQVRRGESISSIARQYGVTVDALIQANGLSNPNYVYAGQLLIIP